MGRESKEPAHLLDTDADQNIGNSTILQPQAGAATVIPETNPPRLLQLTGPSRRGQTTSIIFTASRIVGNDNPTPGYAGPITGVVEFGNGGRFTRVEVDVPIGPYLGTFQAASQASEPQDGGTIVTVPTGVLRTYCRYDNLLCQPNLNLPTRSTAQILGVPFIGPGGPRTDTTPVTVPAEPVLVKSMAAYFSRHFSRSYKTQYCYVGQPGIPPQPIAIGQALYCIPAHAKSVRVMRDPMTAALFVDLFDGINFMERYAIAGGPGVINSPLIPLVGNETVIEISSQAPPADAMIFLALVYEIGI